ncbi:MAG: flavin reductase family protein [Candidatus Devosia phytovorans]|uniref:Flavin reductase family protein n=1 Tax=Candidatus Devosia phytovorans TaxID=3121372 RepID=A0AAJ5VUY0_9HYPH|nr:flavin reductase family protein [Devosia sp.]WEK05279.1 MAG: flavin reductase family protein [Devosia sp.]
MSEVMSPERVIDVRTFWQAVGLRAVGTAIVTAEGNDGPRGFLALSATHLCASPPTMMISVDKNTSAVSAILEGGHFAINYLSTEQGELAGPFGGKGELKGADRFTLGSWTKLTTGAPVLDGASGVIDCEVEETIERHGTLIVLGRVRDFAATEGTSPMVSYKGKTL